MTATLLLQRPDALGTDLNVVRMQAMIDTTGITREFWDRQDKETAKAYRAFCVYRDMGIERSIQKAADQFYGRDAAEPRQLEVWSVRNTWVRRVEAYDDWLEARARVEAENEIIEMRKRHATLGVGLQTVATQALQALQQTQGAALTPRDVVRFMTQGATLERLARGEATAKVEHSGSVEHHHGGVEDEQDIVVRLLADPESAKAAKYLTGRLGISTDPKADKAQAS